MPTEIAVPACQRGKRSFTLLSSDDRANNDPGGSVNGRALYSSVEERDARDRIARICEIRGVIYIGQVFCRVESQTGTTDTRCSGNVKVSCHEATTGTSGNFYHAHTPLAIMPFYCKIFLMFSNMCRLRQATAFSRQFLPSAVIVKDKSDSRRF